MSDERLIDLLAVLVMGWKPAPGRFIKCGACWTPRWRFAPLTNLDQAFELLDRAASAYTISRNKGGGFKARVHVGGQVGEASGNLKARTITTALAYALGVEVPDEVSTPPLTQVRRRVQQTRRIGDGA